MILEDDKLKVLKEILDDMDKYPTIEELDGLLSVQDRCVTIISIYPRDDAYRQVIEHLYMIIGEKIENLTKVQNNE